MRLPAFRTIRRRALDAALCAAWLGVAWISIAAEGGPNRSCGASVYRDPVTGRLLAIGDAPAAPRCRGERPR